MSTHGKSAEIRVLLKARIRTAQQAVMEGPISTYVSPNLAALPVVAAFDLTVAEVSEPALLAVMDCYAGQLPHTPVHTAVSPAVQARNIYNPI